MEKMKEYTPDNLFQKLIREIRSYHMSEDMTIIEKAYEVAFVAHSAQKRKSGEPYIIHPLQVAIILAKLHLDKEVFRRLKDDTVQRSNRNPLYR